MENFFANFGDLLSVWVEPVLAVIGGFAVVATVTPNKVDDRILQILMDLVNFLGANFGKAKNDPTNQ